MLFNPSNLLLAESGLVPDVDDKDVDLEKVRVHWLDWRKKEPLRGCFLDKGRAVSAPWRWGSQDHPNLMAEFAFSLSHIEGCAIVLRCGECA